MTIQLHEFFISLRNEYPDLDAVVRSILLARSQDGATIGDVEDDYYKMMGSSFPLYENITEFLLSIPYVTALCDEKGRLLFNVLPTPKTQHIYDMVQQQKPQQYLQIQQQQQQQHQQKFQQQQPQRQLQTKQQQQQQPQPQHNQYKKQHTATTNFGYNEKNQLHKITNNKQANDIQNDLEANYYWKDQQQQQPQQQQNTKPTNHEQQQHEHVEKVKSNAVNKSGAPVQINVIQSDNNNWRANKKVDNNKVNENVVRKGPPIRKNSYQDNCNHLLNRLYNQSTNVTPQRSPYNFNNIHPTNHLNQRYQHTQAKLINQQNSQYKQQHNNNFNINNNQQTKPIKLFKQPAPPMLRSIQTSGESRASSPSLTKSSHYTESIYTTDSDYEAHLLDFPLLGDDFFLFLARMELRCKFKKFEKVLQSGLCVSGQTISAAIRRVRHLADQPNQSKSIIVNIGSVDIMKGRSLIQIEHDFRVLLNLMFKKGYTPILTTLAPIANYAHDKHIKTTLTRFNEFIKKEGRFLVVMDVWSCLVNERGQILFDCYQSEPRMVTGASEPYVFWNKIGRQRVLQLIESQLEY